MQMIRMLTILSRIGFSTLINWTGQFQFCSVALPHGAVGWSTVCDCGFPLSNSLVYFKQTILVVKYVLFCLGVNSYTILIKIDNILNTFLLQQTPGF